MEPGPFPVVAMNPEPQPSLPTWRLWGNALATLKWCLLLGVALALLPVLALRDPVFAGVFGDLGPVGVGLSSLALFGAGWSLLYVCGMLVDAAPNRFRRDGILRRGDDERLRWLPAAVVRNLAVPMTPFQVIAATGIALPGVVVMALLSTVRTESLGYAAVAWIVSVGAALLFSLPLYLDQVESRGEAAGGPRFLYALVRVELVRSVLHVLRWLGSAPLRIPPFHLFAYQVMEDRDGRRQLRAEHFVSFVAAVGTFVGLGLIALVLRPPYDEDRVLQAPFLVFALLTMVIWIVGALEFHLTPKGIPPLGVAAVLVALGYGVSTRLEHHYAIERVEGRDRLTPLDVVAAGGEQDTLVVVCATGGGILAAGWTAHALEQLTAGANPAVPLGSIRLVSTVSGSSVGLAFWLHSRLAGVRPALPDDDGRTEGLGPVAAAAVQPSLPAVCYGMVFPDFLRTVTLGLSGLWAPKGRGAYLDEQWQATARHWLGMIEDGESFSMESLRAAVRSGRTPAPIFNTTAMETGRRVMLTPVDFDGADDLALRPNGVGEPFPVVRGPTLGEYLLRERAGARVDIGVWTAARLSATFPYVTPAASPSVTSADEGALEPLRAAHHLIDGGYYDNYGVSSALDWLEPVLRAREADTGPAFRRVAIVQLRAFPTRDTAETPPSSSLVAALVGPLVGIARIRDGAAYSRNEIALAAFLEKWNARLATRVELETFVFSPDESREGPLNWRMTRGQIGAMRKSWADGARRAAEEARLRAFVAGGS